MNHLQKRHFSPPLFFLLLLLASFKGFTQESTTSKEISKTLFVTANTGMATDNEVLKAVTAASQNEESATLLLLGNVTPKGFSSNGYNPEVQKFLRQNLLDPLRDFNGKVVVTPGTNEWGKGGPRAIEDLESFLQESADFEFWPNDGCPLEREDLSEDVVLISVDSQWFLQDWDDHLEMNSECDLDTREKFFTEFKDDLGDSQGKTVIVAIHHPVMTATRSPFFRRIAGTNVQDLTSKKYKELSGRLETLASLHDDVIFVSGNDRNLQLLQNDRNPQIISGAAGSTEAAKGKKDKEFASDEKGYAKIIVFEDGSSKVEFYSVESTASNLLFSEVIPRERPIPEDFEFPEQISFPERQSASIYTPQETNKSKLYNFLWGERYRDLYDEEVEVPVLILDSLPGNVRPISEGGGQQSRSLRLINDSENEYTLRAIRKAPLQYVQADLVKTSYIRDFLDSTVVERYIEDYFTTAHPYAAFAVNDLADAADILHATPKLYYVPKQKGLGIYSEDYGDALFMLEEHIGEENREFEIFGSPDNILSTADLLLEMRESKDAYVDQESYIRARLFDMLIGDWDRHQDQWRWAQYEKDGQKRFEAIPRDRDHAFSKYDGPLLSLIKGAVPLLRKMQSYDEDLDSVKWLNWSGYPLDQRFITDYDWQTWEEQVKYLQENLNDEQIDLAFANLPKEIQEQGTEKVKAKLRGRRQNLLEIARDYYEYLQKHQVITGTEEDEEFRITRKEGGVTEIVIFQDGEETFRNSYDSDQTNEIWLYGLDGNDKFKITGQGSDLIKLKVLGGDEEDTYDFQNPRKAKLYDYRSAENTIVNPASKRWLVDSYEINKYQFEKRKYDVNKITPLANFETDAGFTLGVKNEYTRYGLVRNPFTSQYIFGAGYYFATNGFKAFGSAEYAHVFHNWNFLIEGLYSSPNYSMNYFGWGNETDYNGNAVDNTYNRVKIEESLIAPGLVWRNKSETSTFTWRALVESIEVNREENSFVNDNFSPENDIFDDQLYAGTEVNFHFFNKNNESFPSIGSEFNIVSGYKQNIDGRNNRFGYIEPYVTIDYPLIPSGFAVIATKIGGEVILGDNYEFYHAATIGGNRSLRGYRNHRFSGDKAFYQSIDVRSAVGLIETRFIPLIVGVTAGFDYGRVWTDDVDSNEWHTDYGGSVWINGMYALTLNVGYYYGGDGGRLSVMLNFKF